MCVADLRIPISRRSDPASSPRSENPEIFGSAIPIRGPHSCSSSTSSFTSSSDAHVAVPDLPGILIQRGKGGGLRSVPPRRGVGGSAGLRDQGRRAAVFTRITMISVGSGLRSICCRSLMSNRRPSAWTTGPGAPAKADFEPNKPADDKAAAPSRPPGQGPGRPHPEAREPECSASRRRLPGADPPPPCRRPPSLRPGPDPARRDFPLPCHREASLRAAGA